MTSASVEAWAQARLAASRLAIVSTAVPPAPSGQARVLEALFGQEACLPPLWYTDSPSLLEPGQPRHGEYFVLKQPRFLLLPVASTPRLHRANNWAGLVATVLRRAHEIGAPLRQHRAQAVIGCSGNPFDLPAAFLAARRRGLPFVAWLFDDPVMQWPAEEIYRGFARFWERLWARGAVSVIVPNEAMAATFAARHPAATARVALVRNPAAAACFAPAPPARTADEPHRTIVYTGSVYAAQESAFRNLVGALDLLAGRYVLHIYTQQPESVLTRLGLAGRHVVYHPALPHTEAIAVQRRADVLFLPLSFDSPLGDVILTSAPGKIGEYLAACRPILAHAPADAFVCRFMRQHGAGLVVDSPEPARLAESLLQLDRDDSLRTRLSHAASLAAEEFRVERVRACLARALAPAMEARA